MLNKEYMEENRIINQHSAECEQTINDVVRKCYTENKSTQIKDMKKKMRMHDLKEDMPKSNKAFDEFLYSKQELKLKPFSLEAAKAGKPVCTRDGRKARIICYDRQSDHGFHLVVLVENTGAEKDEDVRCYRLNGTTTEPSYNLMMLPEKKEGWVNVYKVTNGYESRSIFTTKEDAIKKVTGAGYVNTVKIQWEE